MREPGQFHVGGDTYEADFMDAFDALDVVLKLAPLVAAFQSIPSDALRAAQGGDSVSPEALAERRADVMRLAIGPLTAELAKISKEQQRAIFGALLSVCRKKVGAGWGPPLWNRQANALQDSEMPLGDMLVIAGHALMVNLGSFTSALGSIWNKPTIQTSRQ